MNYLTHQDVLVLSLGRILMYFCTLSMLPTVLSIYWAHQSLILHCRCFRPSDVDGRHVQQRAALPRLQHGRLRLRHGVLGVPHRHGDRRRRGAHPRNRLLSHALPYDLGCWPHHRGCSVFCPIAWLRLVLCQRLWAKIEKCGFNIYFGKDIIFQFAKKAFIWLRILYHK